VYLVADSEGLIADKLSQTWPGSRQDVIAGVMLRVSDSRAGGFGSRRVDAHLIADAACLIAHIHITDFAW